MHKRIIILLLIVVLILAAVIVIFKLREEEKHIPVTATKTLALPDDPGLPTVPPGDQIIRHTYYTLSYNEKYEQPDWVMYKIIGDSLRRPKNPRRNNFRRDPAVATGSAAPADYKKSGYDRGHLAPAAAMSWSKTALSETFYMSNMSPQAPQFNRGVWKKLESRVREWALENEELYVITGPVLKGELPTIGKNEVAAPQYYYKVILDYLAPERKAIAFVLSNQKHSDPLAHFAVSIDSVEHLTGIDFFPALPDAYEDSLEALEETTAWFQTRLP